ncbi:MAG TPA: DUF2079 domain-containing protein [Prolixibacteraceae bacterium]|nr:DUF2079 domain-containing protein [Prolixibacteraceae bacterium]
MFKFRLSKKSIPYTVLGVFSLLLLAMGCINHYFFRTFTFDYGNYNFAFWDYAHFRISPMPTYPGNFLQDHFSFTFMFFIPVYWLLNWLTGTYTILLIQYGLISLAAWYTFRLIRLKTDNIWMGVGVLIFYFTLLGRYTAVACDANIAVISACFIPIFLYYFEIKKYLIAFIILLLSLLSRENIPIWFVFIFLVLIIEHRKDKKAVIYSVAGMVISVVYFILVFKVFIPAIETEEKQFTLFNYSALGKNPGEAISFIVHHPIESVRMFFVNHLKDPALDGVKAEFYWVYLISGGFILFLRPQYLIWFIPIVAQKVLNDSFYRWGILTYYSVETVTLLPLSVFLVLSTIKSKMLQNGLIVTVCAATIGMTIYKLDVNNCRLGELMTPSKEKFYDKTFLTPPFEVGKVYKLINRIPSDAAVSTSDRFFSHLAQRKSIAVFPTVNDAEYILFSVYDNYFMISHNENDTKRNQYFTDPQWEIIGHEFPVFLFKKRSDNSGEKKNNFMEVMNKDTLFCDYEKIDTLKNHVLFTNGEMADTLTSLSAEKSHSGNHSIKLTPDGEFSRVIKIDDFNRLMKVQVSVWCHSTEERRSNIIGSCGEGIDFISNETDSIESTGWKRIVLNFWMPQDEKVTKCHISFWNNGTQPAYFDDVQIIKIYKD